jgi:hypothetical protein
MALRADCWATWFLAKSSAWSGAEAPRLHSLLGLALAPGVPMATSHTVDGRVYALERRKL